MKLSMLPKANSELTSPTPAFRFEEVLRPLVVGSGTEAGPDGETGCLYSML